MRGVQNRIGEGMKNKKLIMVILMLLVAIAGIEFFINKDILLFDMNQKYIISDFQIDVNDKSYNLEHKEGIREIIGIYNAYLLQISKVEVATEAIDLYSATLSKILSTKTNYELLRQQIADFVHEHSKPFMMRDYSRKEIEAQNLKIQKAFESIILELEALE